MQRNTQSKKENKARGHDAVLTAIKESGRDVTLLLMDRTTVKGKIVGKDPYTVTVETVIGHGDEAPSPKRIVFFKHGIMGFYGEEKASKKGQ